MTSMRNLKRFLASVAIGATATSCGDVVRNGRAPSYLVIDSLAGIRGFSTAGTPSSTLISDVITNVTTPAAMHPGRAVSDDLRRLRSGDHAHRAEGSRNRGGAERAERGELDHDHALPRGLRPRGRPKHAGRRRAVRLRRRDHRHRDDAATTTFGFQLVRVVAKEEAPLVQLKNSSIVHHRRLRA